MKICKYKRPKLLFDPEILHVDDFNMSSKATWPIKTKFHQELPGVEERKICSNHPGHMTNMAPMPIYGHLQNCFQTQWTDCLKTWHVTLCTRVNETLFK